MENNKKPIGKSIKVADMNERSTSLNSEDLIDRLKIFYWIGE